jgi:transposase-like protein
VEPIKRVIGMGDSEVKEKAVRRRFDKEYKLRILEEVDRAEGTRTVVEILRREGIYRSQLDDWRRKRAQGAFGSDNIPAKGSKKVGPAREMEKLRRQVVGLEKELLHARTIIGIQKKVASLMGRPFKSDGTPETK